MKNFPLRLKALSISAAAVITIFQISCKKETITTTEQKSTAISTEKEAVATTPTTQLSLMSSASLASPSDGAPIILVPGLFGFDRDQLLGIRYWGGPIYDLQTVLTSNGNPTFTSGPGPVSSNYDRAIELYYQIKGGTVDYGKLHSSKYGHSQKVSKTYPGFYPQWDANHPIHLMGHSMGGHTARMLVALLENGSIDEIADPNHAALFDGGRKGWVKSVTTISSPHRGATMTDVLGTNLVSLAKTVVIGAATIASPTGIDNALYDFKLDQWGLVRNPGESLTSYINRAMSSKIWNTNDQGVYDLTTTGGAEKLTSVAKDASDVYYFSYCTRATNTGLITGWEYPSLSMFPGLDIFAYPYAWPLPSGIGNYTRNKAGQTIIDKNWWSNDGVANTYSDRGPTGSTIVDYTSSTSINKGTWYTMPVLNGYDHFAVLGWGVLHLDVRALYLNQANLISHLP